MCMQTTTAQVSLYASNDFSRRINGCITVYSIYTNAHLHCLIRDFSDHIWRSAHIFMRVVPKENGPMTMKALNSLRICEVLSGSSRHNPAHWSGYLLFAYANGSFCYLNRVGRPRWFSWMCVRLVIRRSRVWSRRLRQHSFVKTDHEIFSTVILLHLPLLWKGQLSVSGEQMCTRTG